MTVFQTPLFDALGWTLLHFLWQGTLVALIMAVALAALGRRAGRSAQTNYLVCCAGLFAMALAPVVTFAVVMSTGDSTAGAGAIPAALPAIVQPEAGLAARLAPLVPALTLCWLVGIALMHVRLAVQLAQAQRLKRRGVSPAPAAWTSVVAALCARIGIRRPVRIVESCMVRVPTLVGYFEPVILIPASAWLGLTPDQLKAVIAHELAHVRRHDYLVNLVQAVLEALLFYHPAVWWLSGRLRVEREYCCDDIAVAVGGGRLCYARALSTLDDLRGSRLQPTLASTGGSLMNRIRRLAGAPLLPARPAAGWITSAGVTLAFLATATGLTYPQIARHHARHDHEVHQAHGELAARSALEHVDLAGILEGIDAERADVVRALRDTGMTNQQLMSVLEVLGTDQATFDAIARAARRQSFIDRHVHGVHERIARDIANGSLTEHEARILMEFARTEAVAFLDNRPADAQMHERIDAVVAETRAKIEAAVVAGEMTPQQAEEMLAGARRNIASKIEHEMRAGATEIAKQQFLERQAARVHEQIAKEIEAGRLTEDQARAQLEQMHGRLVEWWHANGTMSGAPRDKIAAELHDARRELEQAVAQGTLTRAEAGRKLAAIERRLAEKRRSMELDEHAVMERRAPSSPAEVVWISIAPALARAAESGALPKAQLKVLHERMLARFNEAVESGDDAAVQSMFDHITEALTEHGVPRRELAEAIDAARRNLNRHMARHARQEEQAQRRRELEAQEHEHAHEHPDGR